MNKLLLIFLLFLSSCIPDSSERTICPCTVTKVSKVNNGFEITVKGRSISTEGTYSSEFTFTTTAPHNIGDEIK